jgi:phosphoglycolate phosphatase-like HAD superfamily hydrolase
MTAIDCTDCYLAIEVGDGVKRALGHHFAGFIAGELAARGLTAQTEAALEKIDRDAWRLAARVLREVEAEIDGALDETLLAPDPQKTVEEILAAAVEIAVAETEQRYLGDDPFGFAGLLEKFTGGDFGNAPHPR